MGKHYIPQEYLRGFSSSADGKLIWMFDKRTRQWSQPAIRQVAQERDFYPPEIEQDLNRLIESPGNLALRSVRSASLLSPEQFESLIVYAAVMLTRVPRKRRKGREAVPEVIESTMSRFRAGLVEIRTATNAHSVDAALQLLDELEAKYSVDPPDEIQNQITSPWPTLRVAEVVRSMTWRLVSVPPPLHVITSDNPAYFFESLGLGRPNSELTFPLSPGFALMGSRQGPPGALLAAKAKPPVVKEINRRMAAGAERFVFSHMKASWIESIALRHRSHITCINW